MLTGGSLTPAYGRTYTKIADIEKDFREGKDFLYHGVRGGGYCSINDFEKGALVQLRFGKFQEKVTCVEV
jgi:hypothetical protein